MVWIVEYQNLYSVIVWVRARLKGTVVMVVVVDWQVDNLSGSYRQSQSCLLVDGVTSLVTELIGHFAVTLLDVDSFF